MRTLPWITLLLTSLAGCSATETPPSMSPDGAATSAEPAGKAALATVPAWMSSAAADASLVCYLDVVEGALSGGNGWRAAAGDAIRIAGWAVETGATAQRAGAIRLHSLAPGGTDVYFAAERSDRADVSASPQFAAAPPSNAGLTSSIRLDGVAAGQYEIFYVIGDAGKAVACTLGPSRVLTVG
ncbi:hypothetical protein ABFC53_15705 [Stenotrophomonas pavanii]|uniref:hypothetical protein n=1 Tax=Stenotrophomonas pavanii TaxID=487698 RepID=UPI002E77662B|nr:hypothetical protein [Stenotrophomonas pavanii]